MVMRTTAIALSLAAAGAAHGAGLDADTMRNFGGRYASDCAVSGGLSLRVEPAALVIDVRGRTITGANVQASYSFYGQSPPPGFAVALQSELRDGKELVFLVHQDASGQRIELTYAEFTGRARDCSIRMCRSCRSGLAHQSLIARTVGTSSQMRSSVLIG